MFNSIRHSTTVMYLKNNHLKIATTVGALMGASYSAYKVGTEGNLFDDYPFVIFGGILGAIGGTVYPFTIVVIPSYLYGQRKRN